MTRDTMTAAFAAALIAASGAARAGEEKVDVGALPATVKAALRAKFPGAEWKGASKEQAKGETSYEVALTFEGDKYSVTLEGDGAIEEVERAIFPDALPEAALKAIKEEYPKAKIEEAEQVTDEDQDVFFELTLKEDGKKAFEVRVTDEGEIKKESDKEDEDEKTEKADKDGKAEKESKKDS